MPHLVTDWSTEDPRLADMLRGIAAYPEYTAERMELEAALHRFQADWCLRRAGELRARQRDRENQSQRNRRSALTGSDRPPNP